MNIELIHPQLQRIIRYFPPLPFHNRVFLTLMKIFTGAKRRAGLKYGVNIQEFALSEASVRVYRPLSNPSGAGLLWVHGGGYIIGSAAFDDKVCARYARDMKLVVVSVDYRLAPGYPFPIPLNDCHEAWHWLLNNAEGLGISKERIAISGQSAGGGLVAALVQRLFDEGGDQPAGQALFCPMLNDITAARFELDKINHPIWNNRSNRRGWACYLGQEPGLSKVAPYAVPARRENLSGLPPAWIGIGDIDLFYEDSCNYAALLTEAGVDCEFKIVPGAPHGFETIAPNAPITREFFASHDQFLKRILEYKDTCLKGKVVGDLQRV